MHNLRVIGLNHKTAPVEIREKFTLNNELENYYQLFGKPQSFTVLNTCNRTEVITIIDNSEQEKLIKKFILEKENIEDREFDKYFYNLSDREALKHLLEVSSGLNSLVLGESQILGQIKDAFELSIKNNFAQLDFASLYQQILQCAKRVQRETNINKGSLSVPYIATQLVQNIFEAVTNKTALLIGAGEMCELTGVHLKELGIQNINVTNRNLENAQNLANKFNGKAYPLDELEKAIFQSDIIISSTSSPTTIISKDMVSRIITQRPSNNPLFFIDIAVPRDIDNEINELDNTFLYNIDDLKKIVDQNRNEKLQQLGKANLIINEEIQRFEKNLKTHKLAPIIKELKERLELVKNEEVEKLMRKNNFDEKTLQQISYSMQVIINKILHDPIINLRENVTTVQQKNFVDTFKEIFNL